MSIAVILILGAGLLIGFKYGIDSGAYEVLQIEHTNSVKWASDDPE